MTKRGEKIWWHPQVSQVSPDEPWIPIIPDSWPKWALFGTKFYCTEEETIPLLCLKFILAKSWAQLNSFISDLTPLKKRCLKGTGIIKQNKSQFSAKTWHSAEHSHNPTPVMPWKEVGKKLYCRYKIFWSSALATNIFSL